MKPLNYKLQFEPDLNSFTFQGLEDLTFDVEEPTDTITLDSVGLTIETCDLKNTQYKVTDFKTTDAALTIQFDQKLPTGTYELQIKFNGELKNNLSGFYRSRVESSIKEEYIATTQFEPSDARYAFPGIDHPSYKAKFDVTMIVAKDLTAISNGSMIKEEMISDDRKKVVFETTPHMSTYLLYLGVGKFEIYEEKYNTIQIRGITTRGKSQYTKFAIDCAKKSLEYFEQYFDEPYPLKKLDLIAVPDFAAGAMENWGAITFRENAVLFYEGSSSIATKQRIAEVVAHEVAHQWFGNLVTMKWWDDLWLNESFATFMAYKVIDNYWPEWNIWTEYVLTTIFPGMRLDSLRSSHPIHVAVNKIEEANELFDEIAYDKGGSILRMIEGYLGNNEFRDGLRLYIQKYKYANTEASNLWACLEKASGKPITSIMDSQINQTGFPYITPSMIDGRLQLSQSRFLLKGEPDETSTWNVPATVRVDDKTHSVLFENKVTDSSLSDDNNLLYINANYNSFFITDYSTDQLNILGKKIDTLSDIEKIGLIHDLEVVVFSGRKPLAEFNSFVIKSFAEEKSAAVLLYLIQKLYKHYRLLKNEITGAILADNAKRAIEITGYVPQEDEHPYTALLRTSSLFALSLFENDDVKKFTAEQFSAYLKDPASLHADLRTVVYSLAVWFDDKNYDIILNLFKHSSNQEEKVGFLNALGNTKNQDLIQKSLQFTVSDDVRFNQIPTIISSLSINTFGEKAALEWLLTHWIDLKVKAGGTINHIFRRLLKVIIPNCGIGRIDDVKAFIEKNNSPELSKTFDQVLEELEINEAFIKRNR